MKQPKDEIITIMRKKPLQLIGWGCAIYFSAMILINPFIMIHWQIGFLDIYRNSSLGLLSHFLATITLLGTTFLTTYFYIGQRDFEAKKAHKTNLTEKVNKLPPSFPPSVNIPIPIVMPELRDITTNIESTFLKPGAKGEKIVIGDQESKLYQWNDLSFSLNTHPGFLVAASSGAGKSRSSFNLIKALNRQLHYPQFVVMDLGGRDYPDPIASTSEGAVECFDMLHYIAEGRKREPRGTKFPPLVVILEEAEVLWAELSLLKKAELDTLNSKIAKLILTGRKLEIFFMFIVQTGSANVIPTSISNNLSSHFLLRMGKRAATYIYKLPYDMSNLESGIAYFNKLDSFVAFDNMNEPPPMNNLSWQSLEQMSNNAKNKWKLGELYEPVEI